MNFKKLTALFLALLLMLSMAACGGNGSGSAEDHNEPGEAEDNETEYVPDLYTVDGLEEIAVENPITYFTLTVGQTYDQIYTLNAYDNDDTSATIEYTVDEKKLGLVPASVMHYLTKAFEESGLPALSGKMEYSDAEGLASMYVCYADGTVVAADISGSVPEEFMKGYQAMEACFRRLTANIPLYVPTPRIMGAVDALALEEMLQILNDSDIEALDSFAISDVPKDEFFASSLGLSDGEKILNGTACTAIMMTTPYSIVIVTVEDGGNISSVCKDFESSMDWRKWVCVAPTNALIATKDNMVLCLLGSDDLYTSTAAAVKAGGWKEVKALKNPDM